METTTTPRPSASPLVQMLENMLTKFDEVLAAPPILTAEEAMEQIANQFKDFSKSNQQVFGEVCHIMANYHLAKAQREAEAKVGTYVG